MSTNLKRFAFLAFLPCLALIECHHGPGLALLLTMLVLGSMRPRGYCKLGAYPDSNDVVSSLNLDVILSSALTSFKRTILPLTMFATVFRDQVLAGTDTVDVPYYPLQNAASKDFSGTYDFTSGAGSQTQVRQITVNKRKYQVLSLTGRELARIPYLNAEKLGAMKGEKLAYDIIQDVLSVVTRANFGDAVFTGAASGFDSDDVIDIRTACNTNQTGAKFVDASTTNNSTTLTSASAAFTASDVGLSITGAGIPSNTTISAVGSATSITLSANATATATNVSITIGRTVPYNPWPETGRGLLVNPAYDAALLKDHTFLQAYSIGTDQAIRTGRLPNVIGFDYAQSAAIPTNGENLVGMASYMSAILCAFSPIAPPPAVRANMTRYEVVTDPDTQISMEYRVWGSPDTDTEKHVIECNYGFAPGEKQAIKRIVSA